MAHGSHPIGRVVACPSDGREPCRGGDAIGASGTGAWALGVCAAIGRPPARLHPVAMVGAAGFDGPAIATAPLTLHGVLPPRPHGVAAGPGRPAPSYSGDLILATRESRGGSAADAGWRVAQPEALAERRRDSRPAYRCMGSWHAGNGWPPLGRVRPAAPASTARFDSPAMPRRCSRCLGYWLGRCNRAPLRPSAARDQASKKGFNADLSGCTLNARMGHRPPHRHCSSGSAGWFLP